MQGIRYLNSGAIVCCILFLLVAVTRPVMAHLYLAPFLQSSAVPGYSNEIYQQQQAKLQYVRGIIKQYHSCIEFYDVNDAIVRLSGMLKEQDDILLKNAKLTDKKMIKVLGQSKAVNISRLDGIKVILDGIAFNNMTCSAALRLEKEYQLNRGDKPAFLTAGQYSRQQYEHVLQTFRQHLKVQFEIIDHLSEK